MANLLGKYKAIFERLHRQRQPSVEIWCVLDHPYEYIERVGMICAVREAAND